jgi:hypothetical protein
MLQRRPFKQSSAFEDRLAEEAINLRQQAEDMPLGVRRESFCGRRAKRKQRRK